MSQRKADVFDHMSNTAHVWVADVAKAVETEDRHLALRMLRAWLHALRDRLPIEVGAHFAAQLPELIRGIYYDGWRPSRVPVKYGPDEYARRFAAEARIEVSEVPPNAGRITAALREHFSFGQLEDVLGQLPRPLRAVITGTAPTLPPSGQAASAASPTKQPRPPAQRLDHLEHEIGVLTEALHALAQGLEGKPGDEPDDQRVVQAGRQAHEILLGDQG